MLSRSAKSPIHTVSCIPFSTATTVGSPTLRKIASSEKMSMTTMRSTRAPLKLQDLDALPTSVSTKGSSQVTLKEEEHDINFTRLSRLLQVMDIVAQEHVMSNTTEEKKQKTIQFQMLA